MWAKWLGQGSQAAWLASATGVVLLALAVLAYARRQGLTFPEGLEAALLLTLIPLLSPQGWDYVFLLATPAVVLLTNSATDLGAPLRVILVVTLLTICLSLFDLMGRAAYARFMALSIISVCFLVVVAMLTLLRMRRIA